MGKVKIAYNNCIGKPVGRTRVGKPRCRWDNNIRSDLKEIGYKV